MIEKKDSTEQSDKLRQHAEDRLRENAGRSFDAGGEDLQRLLHELQVHQVELEVQNTELRQVRDDLEKALAKFVDLYDFSPAGHFSLDSHGRILSANLTGSSLLGIERSFLAGRNFNDFVAETDGDRFNVFLKDVFSSPGKRECRLSLRRRQESPLWCQVQAMVDSQGQSCQISLLDISRVLQAEAERSKLEHQLHQAQKIESIGQLAGGVAHDFNNMLGVILGYTELALMKIDPSQPFVEDLKAIHAAAGRSADLTRKLLAFARQQPIEPKRLDLNEAVAGLLKMLQRLIGENIHLSWTPQANLWPVLLDASQLDQILTNLCVNARDAIDGIGTFSIKTENCTFTEKFKVAFAEAPAGEYVRLSVSDDGCGIEQESLDRIFEPFFTTKPFGEGTGLGLASVFGAVKQNHGFVEVRAEPGQGATFNIYFPRQDTSVPFAEQKTAKFLRQATETVLLVEDDSMLLSLVQNMLEELDYQVLAAETPAQALAYADGHGGEIQLLISDVIMPEMNGRDLCDRLLVIRPQMKVIFMSGYTADIVARKGIIEEGINFLQKPFSITTLAKKLREVLDPD